ncbi:MAG: M23 family metallopeptidase [Clostridia bacterium]|nr:M23 family metallopeptidase [Clostridia bacterium]
MEIEKKNRFVEFVKNYGLYLAVALIIFIMALSFTLLATLGTTAPVSNSVIEFQLPMTDAMVIKDFSNTELQNNETLNQWEAHLSVDLASENGEVFSILDGTITSVDYDLLEGHSITITHSNGLVSIYSSLAEDITHKVGDVVKAGEKIGKASNSASGELDLGEHLCLTMKLNDKYVDPNNYLNLQEK